ncbi:MAG: winged helix-turn-helix domain-containing protein [Candidatus Micrarchaeota archaeon]
MKKLFFALLLFSFAFAQQQPFESLSSYCFMPAARITLEGQIDHSALENASGGLIQNSQYYYLPMPDNQSDIISVYSDSGNVYIEFLNSDLSYINSHLDYLNSLNALRANSSSNPKINAISNEICRPLLAQNIAALPIQGSSERASQDNEIPAPAPFPPQNQPTQNTPVQNAPSITGGAPTIGAAQKDFYQGAAGAPPTSSLGQQGPSSETLGAASSQLPLIPIAVGSILTLFIVIIAVHFRGQFFRPISYEQELTIGKTQLEILEQISDSPKIPTDIALRINKSKSTVIEHLEHLQKMGMVEKASEPGRKFVYYKLSGQGRTILLRKNQAA